MLKAVDIPENDTRSISIVFVLPVGWLVGGLVKLLDIFEQYMLQEMLSANCWNY